MPKNQPLRIAMSARAVVAIGEDFAPRGDVMSDPGVARDEISSLRAGAEPLVLRVDTVGGSARERDRVRGDWLCDSGGAAPRRVPEPRWTYNDAALAWSSARPWLDAWETCGNAIWMLHAAPGVPRFALVSATCACVRAAIERVPDHDPRAAAAVDAAEAWARDEVSLEEVEAARVALRHTPLHLPSASLSHAASNAANTIHYGAHAHLAVSAAAEAVGWDAAGEDTRDVRLLGLPPGPTDEREQRSRDAMASFLTECADLVRERIRTIDVLRNAVMTRARHR